MTGPGVTGPSTRGAVAWLTAQALVFGAMAALLGVGANAMFLDTYGSEWLPATYIAIGAAGIAVSGAVARSAQRFDVVRIALVVLGGAAAAIGASWVVARAGGAWVSAPLLVLFPILIQLGFVFIGGQAGRLLDIARIKAEFPRVMAGFPAGAVLGGVIAGPIVAQTGGPEDLLLATAVAQAAFAAIVWLTGRRFAAVLRAPTLDRPPDGPGLTDDDGTDRASLRTSFASRFVLLILAYQILSALGSQFADFLVYDRATAQYPDPANLARFLAAYTAVMNLVSMGFLFLIAGPLLRRFGLRFGVTANPGVVTAFAFAMIAVGAVSGGASVALLITVSAARIADVALTDGTTRTSINAMYQVLPERARLSVQAAIEGIGVPLAIAISGVVILLLHVLPSPLTATIVITAITCAVWTWSAIRLYRAYGPALVAALERRTLLIPTIDLEATPEDQAVAEGLLASQDVRTTRLGLDLLTRMSSPALGVELTALAERPDPDIRMAALAGLAALGDESARRRLAEDVRASSGSADTAIRLRAAGALGLLDPVDRAAAAALLFDPDVDVRRAALDSVQPGDLFAVTPVLAGLEDGRSAAAAADAVGRLGDAVLPSVAIALDRAGSPAPVLATRLVRAITTRTPERDRILGRHVGHPDRDLGLVVAERLIATEPASEELAASLDAVLDDDVRHAARILSATAALDLDDAAARPSDAPLRRALAEELDLIAMRVRANRLARHGSDRLGPPLVELGSGGSRTALALEALEVVLGRTESRYCVPLLNPGLSVSERLRLLPDPAVVPGRLGGLESWLPDLIADPAAKWSSAWLRACAIHAARGRGTLGAEAASAARAVGDPIVDEELAAR